MLRDSEHCDAPRAGAPPEFQVPVGLQFRLLQVPLLSSRRVPAPPRPLATLKAPQNCCQPECSQAVGRGRDARRGQRPLFVWGPGWEVGEGSGCWCRCLISLATQ
eukprot:2807311-Rhodomonas_salina.1